MTNSKCQGFNYVDIQITELQYLESFFVGHIGQI